MIEARAGQHGVRRLVKGIGLSQTGGDDRPHIGLPVADLEGAPRTEKLAVVGQGREPVEGPEEPSAVAGNLGIPGLDVGAGQVAKKGLRI